MVFVAETEDNRLVIFGNKKEEGYFYIEFTGNVETPRVEKYKLTREVLIELLERKLDRYSRKGLNVVFEKMSELD